jgi:hypothetical protein
MHSRLPTGQYSHIRPSHTALKWQLDNSSQASGTVPLREQAAAHTACLLHVLCNDRICSYRTPRRHTTLGSAGQQRLQHRAGAAPAAGAASRRSLCGCAPWRRRRLGPCAALPCGAPGRAPCRPATQPAWTGLAAARRGRAAAGASFSSSRRRWARGPAAAAPRPPSQGSARAAALYAAGAQQALAAGRRRPPHRHRLRRPACQPAAGTPRSVAQCKSWQSLNRWHNTARQQTGTHLARALGLEPQPALHHAGRLAATYALLHATFR